MFYLFHHIPKCGGTSFRKYLESTFTVHNDYHKGNQRSHPKEFDEYIKKPVELDKLSANDCLTGHYHISGIKLWERYPRLKYIPHKKFCILREPIAAAKSAILFGIKRGWYSDKMNKDTKERLLLIRSTTFSKTLGIENEHQAEQVMKKYWFIAPLNKIDLAARVIASEVRKEQPPPIDKLNTTEPMDDFFEDELITKFNHKATLDKFIYDLCVTRFNLFYEGLFGSEKS